MRLIAQLLMLGEGMEDERMFEFFGQRNLLPAFCEMVRLEETGEGGREGGREEGQEEGGERLMAEGAKWDTDPYLKNIE